MTLQNYKNRAENVIPILFKLNEESSKIINDETVNSD